MTTFLLGCSTPASPIVSLTPSPTSTQTPAPVPSVLSATPFVSHPTVQSIDSSVESVTRALEPDNASALAPLLLDEIWFAEGPGGAVGELVSRPGALEWLNAHWRIKRTVTTHEYIDHYVLLTVTSEGWAKIAPLQRGVIVFNLHRYDTQGRAEPLGGNWRIDGIIYQ